MAVGQPKAQGKGPPQQVQAGRAESEDEEGMLSINNYANTKGAQ